MGFYLEIVEDLEHRSFDMAVAVDCMVVVEDNHLKIIQIILF